MKKNHDEVLKEIEEIEEIKAFTDIAMNLHKFDKAEKDTIILHFVLYFKKEKKRQKRIEHIFLSVLSLLCLIICFLLIAMLAGGHV